MTPFDSLTLGPLFLTIITPLALSPIYGLVSVQPAPFTVLLTNLAPFSLSPMYVLRQETRCVRKMIFDRTRHCAPLTLPFDKLDSICESKGSMLCQMKSQVSQKHRHQVGDRIQTTDNRKNILRTNDISNTPKDNQGNCRIKSRGS